jgi:hypothetical protein
MVTSIAVTAGIAATWFYGGPALYCLGFYATQYMVPTTGFSYFAYGFPLYNNAGIALATSPIAQSALAAAVATAAVYAANITISLSENTLNAMDYVKNNFGNTNYYSTI